MPETTASITPKEDPIQISWVDFLQSHPPGSVVTANGVITIGPNRSLKVSTPEIQLFCPNDTCNSYMFFVETKNGFYVSKDQCTYGYLHYTCRHCQKYTKTFALEINLSTATDIEVFKFGELPHFGPPVPPRMLRLIQPDRELFLSGRRCENQGLGIGAFTYYRRVVENQWSRLVAEIIKVAKAINAPEETLTALEEAQTENQFNNAVKKIKNAIPPVLLINGHNPLTLLYSALSQGVHDLPDEECLSLATSIRVVLFELAEKLGQALKDEQELNNAVSRLLQAKKEK